MCICDFFYNFNLFKKNNKYNEDNEFITEPLLSNIDNNNDNLINNDNNLINNDNNLINNDNNLINNDNNLINNNNKKTINQIFTDIKK